MLYHHLPWMIICWRTIIIEGSPSYEERGYLRQSQAAPFQDSPGNHQIVPNSDQRSVFVLLCISYLYFSLYWHFDLFEALNIANEVPFVSFFTQPADIVVLNEMKVPSWYFGFLQETIRDVISIAWWLWTAESLVIISDDLDALEIWSSTSTPMRPQQRFHDHKYKITKNTQKQIHQYIWSKTHKYLIIHLYTNEATAKRIRSFYSTAVFHKIQQYA